MAKGHKFGGHARAYIKVWAALLVLTAVTVSVSYYDFGDWNAFVAMLVATVKGVLVCLFFMHLMYDNRVNQVVFISAFVFLAIFILLTGSDEWFRREMKPVKVTDTASAALGAADMEKLMKAAPELAAKGKEIYGVQCAACHGADGKGDGPAASALNPKPRDFTSGVWKLGGTPSQVFHTITHGSPGTSMAGFASVSVPDRWALVAYLRSLSPNKPEDTPETLKQSGVDKMLDQGPGTRDQGPKTTEAIPVSFAMKQYVQTDVGVTDLTVPPAGTDSVSLGQKIYQSDCMSCHGFQGKGGIPVSVVGFVSEKERATLKTKDFAVSRQTWTYNQAAFIDLVSNGLPGRNMPGFADYSAEEWSALYRYVQSLRAR
ncbi:MAG: c-type cytochrome [Deltaproteobacteria bacterium]|nr:c-type cytochrome [Deltaproteobacteria bacterium]